MDARIQPQSSICSDSNGEENSGNDAASVTSNRRICLVGNLAENVALRTVAESFRVPVVSSGDGKDCIQEDCYGTIFVLEQFDGDVYSCLCKQKQSLLGPVALQQLANKNESLPDNTRPLFNLSMTGVVVCFTGFRDKNDLASLVPLIHNMGGSIRKNISQKVTHLIANVCGGEKYRYAAIFRVPVMDPQWVYASWQKRNEMNFSATLDVFVAEFKLKPFHGAKVCFIGFAEDEKKHMTDILLSNGGTVSSLDDPQCTHVVMEHAEVYTLEAASAQLSPTEPQAPSLPDPPDDNLNYNGFLETLHEKSRDNCIDDVEKSLNLSPSEYSSSTRKRKNSSADQSSVKSKRRKDKCASEKKSKVSGIFKTPLNYFSNRRRTIDASSFSETLNQSVISSSGVFNVEAIENLSILSDSTFNTPKSTKKQKKNLFVRTFSSSKFTRTKLKKSNLNATRLSFDEHSDQDGNEPLNASCFPNISLNPVSHSELRSDCTKDARGPSVPTLSVVDESSVSERPETSSAKIFVVKAEWFWTSVQKETCLEEKEYLYDDYVEQTFSPTRRESHAATPTSASRRKRKRLHEAVLSLTHQQSPVSGSFLDCTASPDKALVDGTEPAIDTPRKGSTARQQVFLELLQTECNYVHILHTIMTMFKKHLEEMPEEEALINNTELNLIFGKVPAIYETHVRMRDEFRCLASSWSEDYTIGSIIQKYSKDLLKAYPPYINYFEEVKEVLTKCDNNKPRFHAFLKACQTKPECGRQSLQELMIRPVQRLGSICLLLANLLKNTPKSNPDHIELSRALDALKEGMDSINEDKRKAEAQVALFNMFNDIDNCPPDIVCSHRKFIAKAEVIQVSTTEGLSSKGNSLILFLFSDLVEVCKKKSKAFNNPKSPSGVNTLQRPKFYKHVKLLPLNTIKKVIDIKETEQCQKVFCLVCRNNDELKERVYSFAMPDEESDKTGFLRTLTKQMANNACTPDADKFLASLESHQLDIDLSDMNKGTLTKAFKFATRTKLKVGRAFSFNKTPSKLKRAVSSMMSPFGSSNNLTPSSELAQMRLASYNNISELGNAENASESPPTAPMSVQPTRKMKTASLTVNAMKRM
ncbi:protein ECT2 isoform X2 [Zophobas morio]|uniref:protein ECT2 isoform X2 n=1 Tax=Zophobas morio TaxID=2755281 RepID=UPI0030831FEE